VLQVALRIVDEEGLDALRIRRLGEELGVNGASLYHHFANKDEILAGIAELALQYVRTPDTRDEHWPQWLLRNNIRTRQALLDHPNLIPVVMARAPLGIGTSMLESSAHLLVEQGVPVDLVLPLMEAMETVAVSSAMYAHRVGTGGPLNHHDHPTLMAGHRCRGDADEQLFVETSLAVIEAVQRRIAARATGGAGRFTEQCWVKRLRRDLMSAAI
jgi:AcrR family transcriptional regulator